MTHQVSRTRTLRGELGSVLRRNDRGIALPMVLLVFIVGVALISAFLVAIVGSSKVTVTSKGNVQSQAAAEAGIASMWVAMSAAEKSGTDLCAVGVRVSTVTPIYSASNVCNTDSVTVTSKGTAENGATQTIEAVYALQRTAQSPPAALRTSSGLALAGNGSITPTDPAVPADIYVEDGDLTCGAGASIGGSVYVLKGKATLGGTCPIAGNLYAFGDISIPNGQVAGDVVSITGSVSLSGGGKIAGNVFAAKNFTGAVNKGVGKNVHIGANASFSGKKPVVLGTLTYGGSLSPADAPTFVAGGAPIKAAPPSLKMPVSPGWIDLTMKDITDAKFVKKDWNPAWNCTVPNNGSPDVITEIQGYTSPTVLDASSCAGGFNLEYWGLNLKLKTDVVIVSNSFFLRGFQMNSADGAPHKIWFVVPTPKTCTGTDVKLDGIKFTDKKVTSLAYSPCNVHLDNSGGAWHGSIFSGSFSGTPLFEFTNIGLPGKAPGGFGGGASNPPKLMGPEPVSQRNVSVAP